jgi:hypothetical protein
MRKVVVSLALAAATVGLAAQGVVAHELTFEDRVKAQEAIDRVYYAAMGGTKPIGEVVPRERLEAKVRDYLKKTVALERFWRTPVTRAALRRELEQMSRDTIMPDRLRELYAALGNEGFLAEECLARPALVNRLVGNFFAFDETIHGDARRMAEAMRDGLEGSHAGSNSLAAQRTELLLRCVDETGEQAAEEEATRPLGGPTAPEQVDLTPEGFERAIVALPGTPGQAGEVREEATAFIFDVVVEAQPGTIRLVRYSVPKVRWEDWWREASAGIDETAIQAASAEVRVEEPPPPPATKTLFCDPAGTWDNGMINDLPDPRGAHTAVWTGEEMIVWGGHDDVYSFATGGRYDPATDTWRRTSVVGAPFSRSGHSAIWTGREMIIWGGRHWQDWSPSIDVVLGDGARYDPLTDTWRPVSMVGAPPPQARPHAVWTGTEMIVWGETAGGRYDPATDTWRPISSLGAPSPGTGQAIVWIGSEMIVLSGDVGARYNPGTDTWMPMSMIGADEEGTDSENLVWTGREVIGIHSRYDPSTDAWRPISTVGAPPSPYDDRAAVWTGTAMIVLRVRNTGFVYLYEPDTDTWRFGTTSNAPRLYGGATVVWTGTVIIEWGGFRNEALNRGAKYSPVDNRWTPTSTNQHGPTTGHAVWAGIVMITWGATDTPTGADRYDPVTDTWSSVPVSISPDDRAVWTGREVVWLEYRYDPLTDVSRPIGSAGWANNLDFAVWTGREAIFWGSVMGGAYDLSADSWRMISTLGAPVGGVAVWDGSEIIAFNGAAGARYDPATNVWTPISTAGVSAHSAGAAVWTGEEMIVWCSTGSNTWSPNVVARYDPRADTWMMASMVGAPLPRAWTSAVWTGKEMVIWGGGDSDRLGTNTGGRYDPVKDAWAEVSSAGAPVGRTAHTNVWTGNAMIVWGGVDTKGAELIHLNNGGHYVLGSIMDDDGDGYTECQGDCSNDDSAVHPGASEVCDGIDNDCDGVIDDGGEALCDDGDVCTLDRCEAAGGCVHAFVDTYPPSITCPMPSTVECEGDLRSQVNLPPATANDVCQPSGLVITNSFTPNGADASGSYPLGTTTVTFTATDAAGNQASCQTTVTVQDTIPPVVTVAAIPNLLWPPDHKMVSVNTTVVATDSCDPAPSVILASVTSNEPDDSPGEGNAQVAGDIQGASIGTPDFQVLLRAERNGSGPGRVYTITYQATDASGNSGSASAQVIVPHDMGQGRKPLGDALKGAATRH